MKPLITLRDEDIFPNNYFHGKNTWESAERVAVRCIVEDEEGNIALCGTYYRLLPGGGVEQNETLEQSAT
jgi:8-oxo-dGTP pyrophosphatase MutT (NUDIX family)